MGYRPKTDAEWAVFHAFRGAGIGGSEAPIIAKVSPWCTPFELWLRRKNLIAPQEQTYPMRRGIKFEPLARAVYTRITGIEMPAAQRIHPARPELRANFDGINDIVKRSIEIKCPGEEDRRTAKVDKKVPRKYMPQCRHLLAVPEHDEMDYVSFDTTGLEKLLNELGWQRLAELLTMKELEARTAIIPVKRDLEQEGILLAAEGEFWRRLLTDSPPPIDPNPEDVKPARPEGEVRPPGVLEKSFFKVRKNRSRTSTKRKCELCKKPIVSVQPVHTHCERLRLRTEKKFQLTLVKGGTDGK